MLNNLLLIGLGGGLGSMARYLCQRWFAAVYSHSFPWGTFAVNLTGCLLIGVFWGITYRSFDSNEQWKLFLMTGICGGFTTFSAFSMETLSMLGSGRFGIAATYILLSLAGAIGGAAIGIWLARVGAVT